MLRLVSFTLTCWSLLRLGSRTTARGGSADCRLLILVSPLLNSEYHLNNDIALAVYQQYASTQNRTFLETKGWPIIRSVAEFWANHVVYNSTTLRYDTFNET